MTTRALAGPVSAAVHARAQTHHLSTPRLPRRAIGHGVLLATTTLLAGITVIGLPYYRLARVDQVRHPLHAWFKSSGYLGQTAGILALTLFLFLWLYPLRKRYRWLGWTGTIARWLDVHTVAALSLPLLVAVHAAWRFGGVIGLGFWAMMIVWASGIVGRYLYARIPRSREGVDLTREEIAAQRQRLLVEIACRAQLDPVTIEEALTPPASPAPATGVGWTVRRLLADDGARRRTLRALRRRLQRDGAWRGRRDAAALRAILRLANREIGLVQQARMLDVTQRLLRYWHVAHRPLAVTALAAVIVHVAVVVALGATWFR